jgi:hypothetical protein
MENHDSIVHGMVGSSEGFASTGATGDSAGNGGPDSEPTGGMVSSGLAVSSIASSGKTSGAPAKKIQKATISDRKLAANRRNARLSTGPKTAEGKAKSSRNSYKLGIFTRQFFPPTEQGRRDWETRKELVTAFYAEYRPQGPTEELLVDKVVCEAIRYARILGFESQEINRPRAFWNSPIDKVLRSQTAIHRQLIKAIAQLEDLQAKRKNAPATSKPSGDGTVEPCEVLREPFPGNEEQPSHIAQENGSGTRPVHVAPSVGAVAVQPFVPASGKPSASPAAIANSIPLQTENYKTNPPSTLSGGGEGGTQRKAARQQPSLVELIEREWGLAAATETKNGLALKSNVGAKSPEAAQGPSQDDILECL